MIVTIDGPAGAGKSTTARALAGRLGFRFLDTGAMYRAVTLAALEQGVDLHAPEALAAVARRVVIALPPDRVVLDGRDVTEAVRSPEVTDRSRYIASAPGVREWMVTLQRQAGAACDVVTEGRDQGTIVFPHAEWKFFLTVSDEEAARRRTAELRARGEPAAYDQVLGAIRARNARDRNRAIAPMQPAADAIRIDTTGRTPEAVVDLLEAYVRGRKGLKLEA